jgi:hypothetical protein
MGNNYIQKNGKLAGSYPDPVAAPTAAPTNVTPELLQEFLTSDATVINAWERFNAQKAAEALAEETARLAEIAATEKAKTDAHQALIDNPDLLPAMPEGSNALDLISTRHDTTDQQVIWRSFDGVGFSEDENGNAQFAVAIDLPTSTFLDSKPGLIAGEVTAETDNNKTTYRGQLRNFAGNGARARYTNIGETFDTQAEANAWLIKTGNTIARDLSSFKERYSPENREASTRQLTEVVADATAQGALHETNVRTINYIEDYRHYTLELTGREAIVSRMRNDIRGVWYDVTVKDPNLGKGILYSGAFGDKDSARIFAQEMIFNG